MELLSIPSTSTLSSSQLVPATHTIVHKALYRLSRPSLISLVLDWLDDRNRDNVIPYLADLDDEEREDQDVYPPATSLHQLREIYTDLQEKKGSKRDVVDRLVEGDFRNGFTLYQLAMADMQYLYDHPLSQRWTALKVVRLQEEANNKPTSIPRFHPSTFLHNLQQEVLPDVKAHFNLDRHPSLPLTILRIYIVESPYNTSAALATQQKSLADSSRTLYIAFPDASPFVYISLLPLAPIVGQVSRADNKSLRKLMLNGIPKAFSKPRERYKLESTNLSAKNLEALVYRRGPSGTNAAGGGWSMYAAEKKDGRDNPLNIQLPTPERSVEVVEEEEKEKNISGMKRVREDDPRVAKRRKIVAKVRFGNSGIVGDGKGIERLDLRMEDPYPASTTKVTEEDDMDTTPRDARRRKSGRRSNVHFEDDTGLNDERDGWIPDIRLTFHGSHVHAGIRELVEAGIIDGERMPGWMTGEEGVSVGAVRRGKIRGYKGSGI